MKTKNPDKVETLDAARTQIAKDYMFAFDADAFKSAVAKNERWLRAAYGSIDYAEDGPEGNAERIAFFYMETRRNPDGKIRSNRQTFNRSKK